MLAEPLSIARPDRVVAVVGTGTSVGKTWVSARLLARLAAAGHDVSARKPAQSFEPGTDESTTDAAVLGRATGEASTAVCPPARWYPLAMAPPMAAAALGRPGFTVADLVGELEWRGGGSGTAPSVGLVETAGGVRSPQADDGDAVDLVSALAPDAVLLVADAGLGTINVTRLSLDALAPVLAQRTGTLLVVVLNRFDPQDDLHRLTRDWLAARLVHRVVTVPGDDAELCDVLVG